MDPLLNSMDPQIDYMDSPMKTIEEERRGEEKRNKKRRDGKLRKTRGDELLLAFLST